jgi:hypothetical protein
MKLKQLSFILISILILLSGCFKKEDAITLPIGTSTISKVFLGSDYEKDMYLDISTNTFQEKQSGDWDIRFETTDAGYGIFLNNGNLIRARKIGVYGLTEKLASDSNYYKTNKELRDGPEGKTSMSAIGDWRTYKSAAPDYLPGIYVIELSYETGVNKYKKLQVLNVNDTAFFVRITNYSETSGDTFVIPKDKTRNFTYYSFKNAGKIVTNIEPDKNGWDLVFTRYNHFFYDILPGNEPFPYRVSGVLSNPNKVMVARDSLGNFEKITAASIPDYHFSNDWNVIGYDWKSHAFGAAGNYTVNSQITYIIRDTDGDYYKLRFLDFYNNKGEKGYPKFEFSRIK